MASSLVDPSADRLRSRAMLGNRDSLGRGDKAIDSKYSD